MIIKNQTILESIKSVEFSWKSLVIIFALLFFSFLVIYNYSSPLALFLRGYHGVIYSHNSGYYSENFELKMSSLYPWKKIYYTVDGSIPDQDDFIYEKPLLIDKNKVIRARIFDDGNFEDKVYTANFFRDTYPDIPVVSLTLNPLDLYDIDIGIFTGPVNDLSEPHRDANYMKRGPEWVRPVHVDFYDKGKHLHNQDLSIRVFGGASRKKPQKSMRICADRDFGLQKVGIQLFANQNPSDSKCFVLRNFGNDWGKSLIRDMLAQRSISSLNLDTQQNKLVKVYINGEFYSIAGLYEYLDSHYLENKYGGFREKYSILEVSKIPKSHVGLVYGSEQSAIDYMDIYNYLKDNSLKHKENYEYISSLIDIDNYIDYYLVNTYFGNVDWLSSNIKYWRYEGGDLDGNVKIQETKPDPKDGKWRYLVYDMDVSFRLATKENGYSYNDDNMIKIATEKRYENQEWPNKVFRGMLASPYFKGKLYQRYLELKQTVFSSEYLLNEIDILEKEFEPHLEDFIERWSSSFDPEGRLTILSKDDWLAEVEVLRDFVKSRPKEYDLQIKDVLNIED